LSEKGTRRLVAFVFTWLAASATLTHSPFSKLINSQPCVINLNASAPAAITISSGKCMNNQESHAFLCDNHRVLRFDRFLLFHLGTNEVFTMRSGGFFILFLVAEFALWQGLPKVLRALSCMLFPTKMQMTPQEEKKSHAILPLAYVVSCKKLVCEMLLQSSVVESNWK
jgi:hypothetical protein